MRYRFETGVFLQAIMQTPLRKALLQARKKEFKK
jgi:hypothetical protein